VDDHLGRVLQCLVDEGIERDTIVVFTSDHGEMMGSHDLMAKSVWYEESMGIPFIIRWPGRISPGRQDMPFSVPDVMPSLLGLAGLDRMTPDGVEGTDYSELMLGKSSATADSALYLDVGVVPDAGVGRRGLRTRRHFLGVEREQAGRSPAVILRQSPSKPRAEKGEAEGSWLPLSTRGPSSGTNATTDGERYTLYDLEKDPYQLHNVADENPSLVADLRRELDEWLERTGDPWVTG
jgi:arylsulfatase A-like enzyme